jgi:hypothetical protein
LEKQRINYWGKSVGAVLKKKFFSKEEKLLMQQKVDALEIVKGFPKAFWQYCKFTPEEYKMKKEKFKIVGNYSEIIIPVLSFDEDKKKYDQFYGAVSTAGAKGLTDEQDSIVRLLNGYSLLTLVGIGSPKKLLNRLEVTIACGIILEKSFLTKIMLIQKLVGGINSS